MGCVPLKLQTSQSGECGEMAEMAEMADTLPHNKEETDTLPYKRDQRTAPEELSSDPYICPGTSIPPHP